MDTMPIHTTSSDRHLTASRLCSHRRAHHGACTQISIGWRDAHGISPRHTSESLQIRYLLFLHIARERTATSALLWMCTVDHLSTAQTSRVSMAHTVERCHIVQRIHHFTTTGCLGNVHSLRIIGWGDGTQHPQTRLHIAETTVSATLATNRLAQDFRVYSWACVTEVGRR